MNDNNKNLILAMVLSALVLIGWAFIAPKFAPPPEPAKVESGKTEPVPPPQTGQSPQSAVKLRPRAAVLREGPRVRIETPSLQGSINLRGARFDDLVLVNEKESIARTARPVRLLSPAGAAGAFFAGFGWTGEGVQLPAADTLWQASAPVLTAERPLTLSWTNATGQRFQLIVSVDRDYLFTVRQRVANAGAGPVAVRSYGLVSRAEKSPDPDSWTNHVGPMGVFNGAANYDVNWSTLDENAGGKSFSSDGGWLGFTDKYWLTALAPEGGTSFAGSFRKSQTGAYQADYATQPLIVPPGKEATTTARLFAGAKEIGLLNRYEKTAGIPRLSKAVDWGWFEFFMRPIFGLLWWLFQVTGNFGVAIICLTIIVRTLLFPIAQKQFQSMGAMRKVQPKLKALQDRYKDDKPKLQQEMLKLYKDEKINPAAGCLPLLLQIPIFYALYKVLLVSVEMRHQPFVGWIRDLSAPDPATILNLFGLLNFTPPSFLAIGVLAVLLGITMWLQFKLNPASPDPVQQQVFSIMPWVMMFVMAPFAAGLLVYWITNNVLSIAQQWWLYKKYGLHLSDTHPATT